jgi:hypothetical protein
LINTKRRIEKERVKDVLRHWIGEWKRKGDSMEREEVRPDIRILVRRFGRGAEASHKREKLILEAPTRAKVLGLRRFWEGKAKGRSEGM